MIALMWAGVAVLGAVFAAIVAWFIVVWRRDAVAGRHASIPGAVAEPQERAEEDVDEWWRECEDDALPAALVVATEDHERAFPDWVTGGFWKADLALVQKAMEQTGEAT